jgi:hypothetical protein
MRKPEPAANSTAARTRAGTASANANTWSASSGFTFGRLARGSLMPTAGETAITRSATAAFRTATTARYVDSIVVGASPSSLSLRTSA